MAVSSTSPEGHLIWDWAGRHSLRAAALQKKLQAVREEHEKLLRAREDLLTDIEALEEIVRPMVRAVLVSEPGQGRGWGLQP